MANNYLQFSTQYKFPREVPQEEQDELLKKISEIGVRSQAAQYGDDVDEETPFEDQYAGCSVEMESEGVWFYSEESGEPDCAAAMIKFLQDYFEDDQVHAFAWAYTCSKMRLNEFGGGAVAIKRGEESYWVDALHHVLEFMNR